VNYETIKQWAKESNTTVKELIALAPNNDPFYVGKPAEVAAANWFADLWAQFGYSTGVHLRRVHYRIVVMGNITRPDGKIYENTDNSWGYLVNAGKYARYLNFVSPTALVDHRNPEAIINARWDVPNFNGSLPDPTPRFSLDNPWESAFTEDEYAPFELPSLPDLQSTLPEEPDIEADGYIDVQQGVHIEIWCEKTTMNDILEPLCQIYNANLITGMGEMSITAVLDFMRRTDAANRPGRIIYISDYDPAGHSMPISVGRKIEYFQYNGFGHLDTRLEHVVLTADQVDEYELPRIPIKDSDRRKAKWQLIQGKGGVELDALEALHPGQLRQIVESHIKRYFDGSLSGRALLTLTEYADLLYEQKDVVIEAYQDEIDVIDEYYYDLTSDWAELQAEFSKLAKPLADRLGTLNSRLTRISKDHQDLCGRIQEEIESNAEDIEAPDVPSADLPAENGNSLYASERNYIDQLIAYKQHKQGVSNVP